MCRISYSTYAITGTSVSHEDLLVENHNPRKMQTPQASPKASQRRKDFIVEEETARHTTAAHHHHHHLVAKEARPQRLKTMGVAILNHKSLIVLES